jgi:5-(carboxyamino)imidazole ribonucleotide mutase
MPDSKPSSALVAIIMGSKSDWETLRHADELLEKFKLTDRATHSAHRHLEARCEFARKAADRGFA